MSSSEIEQMEEKEREESSISLTKNINPIAVN